MRVPLTALVFATMVGGCGSKSNDAPQPTTQDAGTDTAPAAVPAIKFFTRPTLDGTETESKKSFFGDVVIIRVTGLPANAMVTLRAASTLRDGVYVSSATFKASAAGDVDTMRDAPTEGTWTTADADGPLWSMKISADPLDEPIAQWALRIDAEIDGVRVVQATLDRFFLREGLTRVDVKDDGLVGAYYAPKDGKKHPTILAFGGSEGGLTSGETAAMYWASLGYASLGVAYFAAEGLPAGLTEVPLEYFERAMKWLDGRSEADATRLAVIGGSRGGELALLLGATFPRIKAVVARVPSGVSWGAYGDGSGEKASWTYAGTPFPWVPYPEGVFATTKKDADGKLLHYSTPVFDKALAAATPEQIDAATFRVEKTNGAVLMMSGADDQLWPSCKLAKYAHDRLKAAGHDVKYGDESLCFEGNGHFIVTPGLPTTGVGRSFHPVSKVWYALGGVPEKAAKAGREADTKQRAFLRKTLGE